MNSAAVGERVLPALQPRDQAQQGTTDELLRLLAGFAALGSALTFFALAADSLVTDGGVGTQVLGGVVGLWAAALTGWGILALRGLPGQSRAGVLLSVSVPVLLPGAAAVVLGVLAWNALLAPAGSRDFDLTLASALVLVLLQLGCHGALRRRAQQGSGGRELSPGRFLGALFLSAVLVAGIVTPGLAASTAGDHAVPHGQHGGVPAPAEHVNH